PAEVAVAVAARTDGVEGPVLRALQLREHRAVRGVVRIVRLEDAARHALLVAPDAGRHDVITAELSVGLIVDLDDALVALRLPGDPVLESLAQAAGAREAEHVLPPAVRRLVNELKPRRVIGLLVVPVRVDLEVVVLAVRLDPS